MMCETVRVTTRIDYAKLASELLRALRGSRSQTAFSRRLGYRCNVAYTWEAGRRFPKASVSLAAMERVGIDVRGAYERFYREPPAWMHSVDPASPDGVAALLRDLKGTAPVTAVAERAERSRFAVSRWLKGQAEPRLPELLRMIEATSLRLLDWLAALVDPEQLPSIRQSWRQLEAARELTDSSPWAPGVLLALSLDAYAALPRHDDGWLAHRLGIDEAVVVRCLQLLATAGQIRRRGRHWHVLRLQSVDTRRSGGGTGQKQWWSQVALERLQRGEDGLYSFNLFTVSEADLARLRELQRAHYRAMRAIIAESEPGERVVLANLQLVPLG